MRQRHVWATWATVVLLACGSDNQEWLGPDRGDPAAFAFQAPVNFECGRWSPGPPTTTLGLFDFYWGSGAAPSQGSIDAVIAAGGTVVRRFHVNGLRAIVPPAAVPSLGSGYGVTDPDTVVHDLIVGLSAPGDTARIREIGGVIEPIGLCSVAADGSESCQYVQHVSWAATRLPDAAAAWLRAQRGITYVDASSPGLCAAGTGGASDPGTGGQGPAAPQPTRVR